MHNVHKTLMDLLLFLNELLLLVAAAKAYEAKCGVNLLFKESVKDSVTKNMPLARW